MNPTDPQAEAVWELTLPHIRSTRRKRRNRRIAGAGAACCGLALWFTLQRSETPEKTTARIEHLLPKIETMAVMRIDENGTIRLEEIATTELGAIELAFGQTPLLPPELAASEIFSEEFPWY